MVRVIDRWCCFAFKLLNERRGLRELGPAETPPPSPSYFPRRPSPWTSPDGRRKVRPSPLRAMCRPSVVSSMRRGEMHVIKKGLLWQQRDRMFSRWKERYFILTKDYLHCFKRSSGVHNISPMGQFIFKVKLVELDKVEWLNKKSYSAIGLTLQGRESRILLRASEGLEDWFEILEECTITSKERRRALRQFHEPSSSWETPNGSLRSHDWQDNLDNMTEFSAGLDDALKRRSRCGPELDVWMCSKRENRLSLLTDVDFNSWSSSPPPSAPSTFRGRPYRLNNDVFFLPQGINNNSVTVSSGRSLLVASNGPSSIRSNHFQPPPSNSRYRERSHSDALNKIRPPMRKTKEPATCPFQFRTYEILSLTHFSSYPKYKSWGFENR